MLGEGWNVGGRSAWSRICLVQSPSKEKKPRDEPTHGHRGLGTDTAQCCRLVAGPSV